MGRSDPAPMLPGIDTERDPLDRYYTPLDVTRGLVAALGVPRHARVIEPSVGGGAWVTALRESGHEGPIVGVDLDPDARGFGLCDEARSGRWEDHAPLLPEVDVPTIVLGNPPFRQAAEHVRAARARGWRVALLLRSTFVEPVESLLHPERARLELWRDDPCTVELTWPHRIRFGGAAGTESVLHSMFVWASPEPAPGADGWRRRLVWPDRVGAAGGCFPSLTGGSHG